MVETLKGPHTWVAPRPRVQRKCIKLLNTKYDLTFAKP